MYFFLAPLLGSLHHPTSGKVITLDAFSNWMQHFRVNRREWGGTGWMLNFKLIGAEYIKLRRHVLLMVSYFHIARFPNWAALLRIVSCFKREFPWCINYIRYINYNFLSLAARVLRDQKHDKKWKKNTFSVPLAQLADLNGEMLSFKEQDIFHISSDTPTTLIWERKITLL